MSRRRSLGLPAAPALMSLLALLALLMLAGARATAQSSPASPTTTISGTVYDSLAGKPLADALVQLIGSGETGGAWNATSDAKGQFELPEVPSGSYLLGFVHPSLDSLGLGAPHRTIDATGGTPVYVELAVPSAPTIWSLLCTGAAVSDSTGLVLGFIRDADSGAPLGGATAVVTWTALVVDRGVRTDRREVPVKSNGQGWYALCGVPTNVPIAARAEFGEDASGYIEITVPKRGLLHRDFSIPRGSAAIAVTDTVAGEPGITLRRGSAQLTGMVRSPKGKPLAGARLMVWGSGITGSTGDDGTFSLFNLPAGTQALEVRYIGYAPKRVAVELASGQTRSVTVTLDERADILSEITVYGKTNKRSHDLTGFLERRASGHGYFLTHADIEKRHPFQFTDLIRAMPGFVVTAGEGFTSSIVSTRRDDLTYACKPRIYVDGVPLYDDRTLNFMIHPSEITGVEAYAGPSDTPPQYTNGKCGSIIIWTGPDVGSKD